MTKADISIPSFTKPSVPFVYIAGVGPGDVSLLTLKVYQLMQLCDVVVYDRLISDEILALIPDNVERIYAGKSCRKHHMTQDEINQTLVDEANKGKVVLRLKGGDPYIFGRGGEEAEFLVNHKVPFDIVPGVNAADGCAAYMGIPLTHRGIANGVRFFTGHQQKGVPVPLDWQGLADPHTTLVVFMGLTRLSEITDNLIEHGLPAQTPAAAIQHGTTPKQRQLKATLGTIAELVEQHEIGSPSVIIIGKVVALADVIGQ